MRRALGLLAMLGILVIVLSKRGALTGVGEDAGHRQQNLSLRVWTAEKPENLVVIQVTPTGSYQLENITYARSEVKTALSKIDVTEAFLEIQPAPEAEYEALRQLLIVVSECGFEEVSIDWGEE